MVVERWKRSCVGHAVWIADKEAQECTDQCGARLLCSSFLMPLDVAALNLLRPQAKPWAERRRVSLNLLD
jgi:hypothetical protein